jgi:ABC-type sugar transport system ATPase subunit
METRSEASAVPWSRRALGKRYGTTVALADFWLGISAGKSVALVGRNGAGKSTLVRLLTGLDGPDSGEIRFTGEPAPNLRSTIWRYAIGSSSCVEAKSPANSRARGKKTRWSP